MLYNLQYFHIRLAGLFYQQQTDSNYHGRKLQEIIRYEIWASIVRKLEKEMATHSSTLTWKSQGRRRLVGYSPWGRKESDMTEQLHFHFHFMRKYINLKKHGT